MLFYFWVTKNEKWWIVIDRNDFKEYTINKFKDTDSNLIIFLTDFIFDFTDMMSRDICNTINVSLKKN